MARQPLGGLGCLIFWGFTITLRHTTLGRTPLDEWPARRRDLSLPDNTQHSQETDIHALGGIRTHNPSKRTAESNCYSTKIIHILYLIPHKYKLSVYRSREHYLNYYYSSLCYLDRAHSYN
jgi:hypothetical protein